MEYESPWIEKVVRPRLSTDELYLIYRLIDEKYWTLRRYEHPFWKLEKIRRLRRKMLRLVNSCRTRYQISLRERVI